MGLDYSYDIYVHRRDAGRLLAAVAQLCDWRYAGRMTIELPDGVSVEMPCGDKDNGQTVRFADMGADTSRILGLLPLFVEDGPLSELREQMGEGVLSVGPDGTRRVLVATTYLKVFDESRVIPDHISFSFSTPGTSRSRLFLSSPSIRETFATLTISVGAPLCLFDVEERHEIVVAAHGRRLSTQVPGPCLLWDTWVPRQEVNSSLMAWLAGEPTHPGIFGPEHSDYPGFVASLAQHSTVTTAVT
jgi:hypothetical protein